MSELSKRARRRLRGRAKNQPDITEIPTTGFYVIRRGNMFMATAWEFFTNPDFTMKAYAYDRATAIDLFRRSNYFYKFDPRPEVSEFKDWPVAARRA